MHTSQVKVEKLHTNFQLIKSSVDSAPGLNFQTQ